MSRASAELANGVADSRRVVCGETSPAESPIAYFQRRIREITSDAPVRRSQSVLSLLISLICRCSPVRRPGFSPFAWLLQKSENDP